VTVHSDDLHVGQRSGPPVLLERLLDVDPELVGLQPRGDVGVRLRVHVRVDAQRDPGLPPHETRPLVDDPQLLGGLHVEHEDLRAQGEVDLVDPLAHPGIDDLSGVRADLERPVELSAGDDVHAAPLLDEEPQDGQVRVCLGRIADDMGNIPEGLVENPEVLQQGLVAVEVKRRADLSGDDLDGHVLAPEPVVAIVEVVHPFSFGANGTGQRARG